MHVRLGGNQPTASYEGYFDVLSMVIERPFELCEIHTLQQHFDRVRERVP